MILLSKVHVTRHSVYVFLIQVIFIKCIMVHSASISHLRAKYYEIKWWQFKKNSWKPIILYCIASLETKLVILNKSLKLTKTIGKINFLIGITYIEFKNTYRCSSIYLHITWIRATFSQTTQNRLNKTNVQFVKIYIFYGIWDELNI